MSFRPLLVLTFTLLVAAPVAAITTSASAVPAPPMTITAVERGSGAPVPGACYYVVDLEEGGTLAGECDDGGTGDAVKHDGQVVLITQDEGCGSCEIVQTLPNLAPGVPTNHLLAPSLIAPWGGPYQFENYLKPQFGVSFRDAFTGAPLSGACIGLDQLDDEGAVVPGATTGACDGNPSGGDADRDGTANGAIRTRRYAETGGYRLRHQSGPAGYVVAAPVVLQAPPAETGDVVTHTFRVAGSAGITIRTVSSRRPNLLLKGACYAVRDRTLAAGAGTVCDGGSKDADRARNGVIRLGRLPAGHAYVLDQTRPPRGYRLQRKDRTVTTVAGKTLTVKVANRKR